MTAPAAARRVLRVVIGSRRLARSSAEPWARREIWRHLRSGADPDAFMSGGAEGPDRWGALDAIDLALPTIEYRLDGRRWLNGAPAAPPRDRWTDQAPPPPDAGAEAWKRWCLARDEALVAAACAVGWSVEVLALIAASRGTHGTEYTARLFRAAGASVVALTSPALE